MPELPDVAGWKTYLDATCLHRPIAETHCEDERIVKGVTRQRLQRRLKGRQLTGSRRWGKWLFAALDDGAGHLVLHFGMTGRLDCHGPARADPAHTCFAIAFRGDRRLAVVSVRRIGRVSLTDSVEDFAKAHDLGPDALDDRWDREAFVAALENRRGSIKSALMDQSILAGIGNVYSDEILFQAGIHPARKGRTLDRDSLDALYTTMRRVLRVACRHGGDGRELPSTWLLGRRGDGGTCPRCGTDLTSHTISERTAWLCPHCQPAP